MKVRTIDDSYRKDIGVEYEVIEFIGVSGAILALCRDGNRFKTINIEYLEIVE